ncbi:MAG: heme ABC exporter ATP-binding protein CcmA [Paracoccaceae bacterium]
MVLNVDNLSCYRGGVAVLDGVNFSLAAGAALILRGPNGSGKTTLLRTVAGLQPAMAGSVTVGADAIAYGAHADGLKTSLSVTDNLTFWAGIYGTGAIEQALDAFELTGLRHRLAQNLSAGQKRRLGLARLLVTGRPIWVLDEPTVSLDADSVALFACAVTRHLEGGGSALIATHIDLGITADELDVAQFHAAAGTGTGHFDEAFA